MTARPASKSARVSCARLRLSSNSWALWIAIPACSANASSTRWWWDVNAAARVRERGDDAEQASCPPAAARTACERMPSRSSTSRRAERGSVRTSSTRIGHSGLRAAPDDPLADRQRQRPPLVALKRRGRPRGPAASRAESSRPMPQPVEPMSAVTERLIRSSTDGDVQPSGDEPARGEERGQLLGPTPALVEQAPLLDAPRPAGGPARRSLSTSVSSKAARRPRGQGHRAEDAVPAHERHQQRGAVPALGEAGGGSTSGTAAALTSSTRTGAAAGHDLGQQRLGPAACGRPGAATRGAAARQHVEHLELAALADRAGPRPARRSGPGGPGHRRRRAARRRGGAGDEQPGDLVEHGDAQRALLQPPHLLDRRPQLAAEAGGQREARPSARGRIRAAPAAHRPSGRAERDAADHRARTGRAPRDDPAARRAAASRHGADPGPTPREQDRLELVGETARSPGDHHDRLAARRREARARPRAAPREAQQAPERPGRAPSLQEVAVPSEVRRSGTTCAIFMPRPSR